MPETEVTTPTPDEGKQGLLNSVINKLSANYILVIVLIVLVSLTIISIIAIRGGGEINIFGFTISASSETSEKDTIDITSEIPAGQSESYITLGEFSLISGEHFKPEMSKNEIIDETRKLVARCEELESYKNQFSFKLVKLEREIHSFGRYIDTKIANDDRVDAYKQIQSVLIEIDSYDGPVNGHQQTTYQTLVDFQKGYNERVIDTIFIPEDYGIFGYRTLEAIRSTYRLRNR